MQRTDVTHCSCSLRIQCTLILQRKTCSLTRQFFTIQLTSLGVHLHPLRIPHQVTRTQLRHAALKHAPSSTSIACQMQYAMLHRLYIPTSLFNSQSRIQTSLLGLAAESMASTTTLFLCPYSPSAFSSITLIQKKTTRTLHHILESSSFRPVLGPGARLSPPRGFRPKMDSPRVTLLVEKVKKPINESQTDSVVAVVFHSGRRRPRLICSDD